MTGTPRANQMRGWVSSATVADHKAVSREFESHYGVRVVAFKVLRQSKGEWTQIEAEVIAPSRWRRWFGRMPPASRVPLTRD